LRHHPDGILAWLFCHAWNPARLIKLVRLTSPASFISSPGSASYAGHVSLVGRNARQQPRPRPRRRNYRWRRQWQRVHRRLKVDQLRLATHAAAQVRFYRVALILLKRVQRVGRQ